MNSINALSTPQTASLSKPSGLRAAAENKLPELTNDETSLIKENFANEKSMSLYSMDGKVNQHDVARGRNIDTRI